MLWWWIHEVRLVFCTRQLCMLGAWWWPALVAGGQTACDSEASCPTINHLTLPLCYCSFHHVVYPQPCKNGVWTSYGRWCAPSRYNSCVELLRLFVFSASCRICIDDVIASSRDCRETVAFDGRKQKSGVQAELQ